MISISVPSLALSANVATHERHERHIETVMLELSIARRICSRSCKALRVKSPAVLRILKISTPRFRLGFCALADVHDLLVVRNWQGADIREVIRSQLMPFGQLGDGRLTVEGSDLILKPKAVEHIGLALHELATNATKYGALSLPTGSVSIHWTLETIGSEAQQIRIVWQESGGPPVRAPEHQGFGHMVVTHLAPKALEGNVELNYEIDGLRWTLVAPTTSVTENQSGQKWS